MHTHTHTQIYRNSPVRQWYICTYTYICIYISSNDAYVHIYIYVYIYRYIDDTYVHIHTHVHIYRAYPRTHAHTWIRQRDNSSAPLISYLSAPNAAFPRVVHMCSVTWLIHMCDITHSYVCRDSFMCVTCTPYTLCLSHGVYNIFI